MIKPLVRRVINFADRVFGLRALMREDLPPPLLAGDRAVEFSWVVAELPAPPAAVIEVGCIESVLSCVAARRGNLVTAVDLRPIEYEMPGVTFIQGDINSIDFGERRFAAIINCSVMEHIGLAGRYNAAEEPDGDLQAMRRMSRLLLPDGIMILTVPVGRDMVCRPLHRIYGSQRLPLLLQNYNVQKDEYWVKSDGRCWLKSSRQDAMAVVGSNDLYALGLFVLSAKADSLSGAAALSE